MPPKTEEPPFFFFQDKLQEGRLLLFIYLKGGEREKCFLCQPLLRNVKYTFDRDFEKNKQTNCKQTKKWFTAHGTIKEEKASRTVSFLF